VILHSTSIRPLVAVITVIIMMMAVDNCEAIFGAVKSILPVTLRAPRCGCLYVHIRG